MLGHVGRVLARKTDDVDKKRKRFLICFGLAVLLMLLGIPWPGMASGLDSYGIGQDDPSG